MCLLPRPGEKVADRLDEGFFAVDGIVDRACPLVISSIGSIPLRKRGVKPQAAPKGEWCGVSPPNGSPAPLRLHHKQESTWNQQILGRLTPSARREKRRPGDVGHQSFTALPGRPVRRDLPKSAAPPKLTRTGHSFDFGV